jgi:ribosomal protein S18 acetylase RimI-like enzyme
LRVEGMASGHLGSGHKPRSACIGTELVSKVIREMLAADCEEVVLEAEISNRGALALYQNLGFLRDKRLHKCAWISDLGF